MNTQYAGMTAAPMDEQTKQALDTLQAKGYIVQSLHDYPAQRGLKTLMERCGYADCGFEECCGGAMAINFGSKTR